MMGSEMGGEPEGVATHQPIMECWSVAKRAAGLTAKQIKTVGPGMHAMGGNLYLQVGKQDARSWVFRFVSPLDKRRRDMGLGSVDVVTLDEAEDAAFEARRLLKAGIDPIEAQRARSPATARAVVTFAQCAATYIETKLPGWRSTKHGAQWPSTLERFVYPVCGDLPVEEVTTSHVLEVLKPIWSTKNETASRVRGRIEAILDSAKVRGLRSGDNPARWTGNLALILPARSSVATVEHHPSLHYAAMPAFWPRLQMHDGLAARALELQILTALRPGEAIGARWSEFDIAANIWTVPGVRMKAKLPHRLSLTPPALALLRKLSAIRTDDLVFPGMVPGRPLSDMAMGMVLRRMQADCTPHGFRATLRTWAAETTSFPEEVCEATLAHVQKNKVIAAYQRGSLFEKRRALLLDWAAFIGA